MRWCEIARHCGRGRCIWSVMRTRAIDCMMLLFAPYAMNRFAELLDRLVLTPSRNGKLTLLTDYFGAVEIPTAGWRSPPSPAIRIAAVKPAMLRALVTERMDPVLFGYSYDYVGDLAETVSLVWPDPTPHDAQPRAHALRGGRHAPIGQPLGRAEGAGAAARQCQHPGAFRHHQAGHRRTSHRRLGPARQAGACRFRQGRGGGDRGALARPGAALRRTFRLARRQGAETGESAKALFRPVMLSNPVEDSDLEKLDPADYAAEWKWDGIRVQAVSEGGIRRLYSRTGDDVSGAFPDLVDAMNFSTRRSMANCWSAPPDWHRHLFRPAAAAEPQDRLGEDPRALSRLSCAATTFSRPAKRIFGRFPSPNGDSGWRISSPCSTRHASIFRRSFPSPSWRR